MGCFYRFFVVEKKIILVTIFGYLSEVALLTPTYEEIKMSEVALLAPTYEYGDVGFVGLFYHSGSSITRGLGGWKGELGAEQYVSCMFHVCFGF